MKITCDICGQPMNIAKAFLTKPRGQEGKTKTKCRITRYHCDLCDIDKTIFADGYRDEKLEPTIAVEQVDKYYSNEQENRI